MTKLLKQLNVEPAIQGDGASNAAANTSKPTVDYSAFELEIQKNFGAEPPKPKEESAIQKTAEELSAEVSANKTPEQLAAEKATSEAKIAEDARLAEEAKKFEGKTPEEIEAIKKAELEIKPENQGTIAPLRFKDDLQLGKEGELTFTSLAKELNLEVKEDNLNALKEAVVAKLESTKNEAWSGNFMAELEKEPAAAQEAFLLAKQGISLEEIAKPVAQIEMLENLPNFELVKKDLELSTDEYGQKLSTEQIESRLTELTEKGEIDKYGNFVRTQLNEVKNVKIKERVDFITTLKANEQKRTETENRKVYESLESQLKNTKEFMGRPLHESVAPRILKQFAEGKYNDMRMPNTTKLLNAIMFEELGTMAINEIRQESQSKIIQTHAKELHNIPPVIQNGVKSSNAQTTPFGELEQQFKR